MPSCRRRSWRSAARTVDRAVLAVPPESREVLERRLAPPDAVNPVDVVGGGLARSDSVLAALAGARSEVVVVHDAARPLVTPALVDAVVARLMAEPVECGGVIAAMPVSDTIKRANPPRAEGGAPVVSETLDRSNLWAVQTPQAFRAQTLRLALESVEDLASATDDAMLVERLGRRIVIHPSTSRNMKITTREDLEVAEHLLGGDLH